MSFLEIVKKLIQVWSFHFGKCFFNNLGDLRTVCPATDRALHREPFGGGVHLPPCQDSWMKFFYHLYFCTTFSGRKSKHKIPWWGTWRPRQARLRSDLRGSRRSPSASRHLPRPQLSLDNDIIIILRIVSCPIVSEKNQSSTFNNHPDGQC